MLDKQAFLDAAVLAARQVGVMARKLQATIQNEGKAVAGDLDPASFEYRQKEAKTAVDEIAQDIIITAVLPHLPVGKTVLDGEEETPGKALLPLTSGEYVLVIDPIDGTLGYLEGGTAYAVHIGLFRQGVVEVALIYYPAQDVAYYTLGDGAYTCSDVFARSLHNPQKVEFAPTPLNPRILYATSSLPKAMRAELEQAGFTCQRSFRRNLDCRHATDALLRGVVAGGVLNDIHVRDLMHVAVLTAGRTSLMTGWNGKPLNAWPTPTGGVVFNAMVSAWPLPDDLKAILARYA